MGVRVKAGASRRRRDRQSTPSTESSAAQEKSDSEPGPGEVDGSESEGGMWETARRAAAANAAFADFQQGSVSQAWTR